MGSNREIGKFSYKLQSYITLSFVSCIAEASHLTFYILVFTVKGNEDLFSASSIVLVNFGLVCGDLSTLSTNYINFVLATCKILEHTIIPSLCPLNYIDLNN